MEVINEDTSRCKLKPGDIVGPYVVEKKIGTGYFCAVYQCRANDKSVAFKIYGTGFKKYFRNEVQLLRKINDSGNDYVVNLYDVHAHIDKRTAVIYPCIITELRGDTVFKLVDYCKEQCGHGLPMPMVRAVARDMLAGLAHLHSIGIIHGDIKPDNLLLNRVVSDDLTAADIHIKIIDFGSSTQTDEIFTTSVGTIGYTAPEIVVEHEFGTAADIWSAFTVIFELIASDLLFDVFFEHNIDYGDVNETVVGAFDDETVYTKCIGCCDDNTETGRAKYASCSCQLCDTCGAHDNCVTSVASDSGDSAAHTYAQNYCYLLLVAKVICYPPAEFTALARDYYNKKGRLISNPDVEPCGITTLLMNNYDLDADECARIDAFLSLGLKYTPDERITAADALIHDFCAEI